MTSHADHGVTRVDVALHPIVRSAVAITLERVLVVGLLDVQEHAEPEERG
jgi:hypothetical protein